MSNTTSAAGLSWPLGTTLFQDYVPSAVLAALAALASAVSAGAQELWASAAPVKLVPAMMPWPFFDAERKGNKETVIHQTQHYSYGRVELVSQLTEMA